MVEAGSQASHAFRGGNGGCVLTRILIHGGCPLRFVDRRSRRRLELVLLRHYALSLWLERPFEDGQTMASPFQLVPANPSTSRLSTNVDLLLASSHL